MTPEQYALLNEVFRESDDIEPSSRVAFIEARCASDPLVLDRARVMLRIAEIESRAGSDSLLICGDGERLFVGPAQIRTPDRVSGFELIREIGRGASGVVYEAHQPSLKRTVAVKVLRSPAFSERSLRRFEREAEILGLLQHPGIAQVYASGVDTSDGSGTPFIAMEFIEGTSITRWKRERCPDLTGLLSTFAAVCDAVHYAHQRGVIHRDLKPANVIVNKAGEPKVVDFGIGRAIDRDVSIASEATVSGEILGTLAYMSPEQASGDADAVDVRSDVYALGAMLHELLTGRPPNETDDVPLPVALDRVRQAGRPDIRSQLGAVGRLRTDLALITETALDPDPATRYASAAVLAEDIRRLLQGEPLLARAPSMSYQLMRCAQRRRAAVAVGAMLAATLITATGVSIRFASIANANRAVAEQRQAETERALGLITTALAAAEPGERDADYTLRTFLAEVAGQLGTEQSDESTAPLGAASEADLRTVIGESLIGLGDPHAAGVQLGIASDIRARTLGPNHAATLESRLLRAIATMDGGDLPGAADQLSDLLNVSLVALGPTHEISMDSRYFLASVLFKSDRAEEAAPIFRDLLESRIETYGETHEVTSVTQSSYALALHRIGRTDEALPLALRAAETDEELLGPEHPGALTSRNNVALMLLEAQRYDEAEPIFRDVLSIRDRTLPPTHRHIAVSRSLLARLLNETERFDEAVPLATSAHELLLETLGPDHAYVEVARDIALTAIEGADRSTGVDDSARSSHQ